MKTTIVFAIALLVSFRLCAQTVPTCASPIPDPVPADAVTLTWVAPTTYSDGSPLSGPITYSVYQSDGKGGAFKACQIAANPGASIAMLTPPGLMGWVITAAASNCAITASTAACESAASNVATKMIQTATNPPPPPPPPPPQKLLVDPASLTAYKLTQNVNKLTVASVGTVAVGTACDASQPVLGRYVVPRTSVQLIGTTTRPNVVIAQCKLQ